MIPLDVYKKWPGTLVSASAIALGMYTLMYAVEMEANSISWFDEPLMAIISIPSDDANSSMTIVSYAMLALKMATQIYKIGIIPLNVALTFLSLNKINCIYLLII